MELKVAWTQRHDDSIKELYTASSNLNGMTVDIKVLLVDR